jgi:hypothetical protein
VFDNVEIEKMYPHKELSAVQASLRRVLEDMITELGIFSGRGMLGDDFWQKVSLASSWITEDIGGTVANMAFVYVQMVGDASYQTWREYVPLSYDFSFFRYLFRLPFFSEELQQRRVRRVRVGCLQDPQGKVTHVGTSANYPRMTLDDCGGE